MTSPLEPDCSQRELAANRRCAVMLSSAFTANISFYSNEIASSPVLPETLAPSFGAGKPQRLNIPFAPAKSRLDVWVSNYQFCTELTPLDDLASGTAIRLVFVAMKTVLALFVHLLATVAKCVGPGGPRAVVAENLLLKHQLLILGRSRKRAPNLFAGDRFLLNLWSRDGLTGFSVTVSLVEMAKSAAHPLSRSPSRTDVLVSGKTAGRIL